MTINGHRSRSPSHGGARGSRFQTQRGIALVVVLWAVTLLGTIAAGFSFAMRTESQVVANLRDRAQARAVAGGALRLAALDLLRRRDDRLFSRDGSPSDLELGNMKARVSIQDVAGRIDLNRASRPLLEGLLASLGVEPARQARLLDAIADWRDRDDHRRAHGAEEAEYRAAGLPFGPKNVHFQSVTELQQVLGMTPELYRRMAPALTVQSSQKGVNPAFANEQSLNAIPNLDTQTVQGYLEQRARNRSDGLPPPPPPAGGEFSSSAQGQAFRVHARAEAPSGVSATLVVVIKPTPGGPRLYRVLEWIEGGLSSSRPRAEERRETGSTGA